MVVVFFASFGERWLIGNGFDFEIFVFVDELEADFLFGVDRFESALDAGEETIEFPHNLSHERDRGLRMSSTRKLMAWLKRNSI